jgi:hypothetical protein
MQVFTIKDLKENGFVGSDCSLDISIMEYGLCWKYIESEKEFIGYYGECLNGSNYFGFQFFRISCEDIRKHFSGESWSEIEDVYSSCKNGDETLEEYRDVETYEDSELFYKFLDIVGYYGNEDCFGSSYEYPSFIIESDEINGDVMNEIMENIFTQTSYTLKKVVSTSCFVGLKCAESVKVVVGELYLSYTTTERKTVYETKWYDIQLKEICNYGVGDMIPRTITMY